jgi:hypothetical protein
MPPAERLAKLSNQTLELTKNAEKERLRMLELGREKDEDLATWAAQVAEQTTRLQAANEKLEAATADLKEVQLLQGESPGGQPLVDNAWKFLAGLDLDQFFTNLGARYAQGATRTKEQTDALELHMANAKTVMGNFKAVMVSEEKHDAKGAVRALVPAINVAVDGLVAAEAAEQARKADEEQKLAVLVAQGKATIDAAKKKAGGDGSAMVQD